MKFSEVVIQAAALIRTRQRVTYRALKLEFDLDDETFAALREELLFVHAEIADADGRGFVWQEVGGQATIPSPIAPPVLAPQVTGGEYRQLSVMFCDLVGSTARSAALDPEALQAIMQDYHARCAEAAARYGGHIAQYLGDGVLVYFGYPIAHEDDAARAVHAGLEILSAGGQTANSADHEHRGLTLTPTGAVQVRIGIHTGQVMVTDVGSGARQETLALGETPNLASRIQHRAAPDTLVIGASTARLVQGQFVLEPLGAQALDGVAAVHELFRVRGATTQRSAFEAAVLRGLTPVVGREHETGLLFERLARAADGYGQVVLISGEPGIGKSRLVQAVKDRDEALHAEYRCSAHFQHSALYPVITFLERALEFERGESAEARLEKLSRLITEFQMPLAETLPLLSALLSLPAPAGVPILTMNPLQQRQRTLSALLDSILNAAARRPVCLIWEDLHWADATTLEFVGMVIEHAATARLLVLATFRPEFHAPWGGRAHISALTLSRLSPSQITAMVDKIARDKPLPAEVVQQILLKTDGVPLFVEELTKMILESGLLQETPDRYLLAGPLPSLAIPDTLQDSLQARLDRYPGAREVAQLGAVLGREFSDELIRAVSLQSPALLDAGLRQLLDAELIFQRGRGVATSYLFKHALVQDTAYQSLLKSRRQQLHLLVADTLRAKFAETVAIQPEMIAHHLTEARQIDAAIPYWQQAGLRALERSANAEAVAHLNKGVMLNRTLPDSQTNRQHEITLLMALAPALMATSGYANPDVGKTYTRVRELTKSWPESSSDFQLLYGLLLYFGNVPEWRSMRELADELVALAEKLPNTERLLISKLADGVTCGWTGRFSEARQQLDAVTALYVPEHHHSLTFQYGGLDPGTFARAHAAMACWYLGYPEQALTRCRAAIELGEQIAHPVSHAHTLMCGAWMNFNCGRHEQAQALASQAHRLSVENQSEFWCAWAEVFLGAASNEASVLRRGIDHLKTTGAQLASTVHLAMLAEIYLQQRQLALSHEALDEAFSFARRGETLVLAELHRLQGELILAAGGTLAAALESFERAIEVARQQQAKAFELRAVMSLARVWQQQGRAAQARVRLAEVYDWFTEGHALADLQNAQALLAGLENE